MAIQSVERALGLFEQLAFGDAQSKGKTLSQLASEAGLARNTTHSLLKTLESRGYAGRGEGGRYVKGPKCLEIAQVENWGSDARIGILRPVVERLAAELHEGVNFTILVHGWRREVIDIESDQPVRVDHSIAQEVSLYRLVSTRALLAGSDTRVLADFVKKHGFPGADWNGIDNMEALERELRKIREAGHCVLAPNVPDVASLAVLVYDRAERFAGALGCYVPMFRYSKKLEKKVLKLFNEAGEELSHEL